MKYKCLKCGHEFEVTYSEFEVRNNVTCPNCGVRGLRDIVTLYKYELSHPKTPVEVPVKVPVTVE